MQSSIKPIINKTKQKKHSKVQVQSNKNNKTSKLKLNSKIKTNTFTHHSSQHTLHTLSKPLSSKNIIFSTNYNVKTTNLSCTNPRTNSQNINKTPLIPSFIRKMSTNPITNDDPSSTSPSQQTSSTKIERFHTSQRFSEAVCYGPFVHLAGQLADNIELDIYGQTQETLDNIDKFLASAGTDKNKIMSVTIYLANMADYQAMNSIWDKWVPEGKAPARTCVEAKLYSPKVLVEMTVVAVRDV